MATRGARLTVIARNGDVAIPWRTFNCHREERCDVAIPWRTQHQRTFRDCFVRAFLAMTTCVIASYSINRAPLPQRRRTATLDGFMQRSARRTRTRC